MKKVLLVNPFGTEQGGFSNPPLGLLYLAGTLLKHDFDVKVIDGCMDGKIAIQQAITEYNPDIVGITCLTPERLKAIEVAQMVKSYNKNTIVVLGGVHPTIMHDQMMENYPAIDYIVIGEGEETLLEIVQGKEPSQISGLVFRKDGKIIKTETRKYIDNIDSIPFPAWHLIDIHKYSARGEGIFRGINLEKEVRVSIIFSRGCTGHCDFCSTWWIWKGWRHRSAKNMTDEISLLYDKFKIRHFCFADDAMTVDRNATIGLCNEIIARKLKIAFFATTRTDCVDEEVLVKLKQAGCYAISFGIETGSQKLLEKMGKENDIATSENAIKLCKKIGLNTIALMIVGNVGETTETIKETNMFLKRTQPTDIGCVGGLWILPGTKLYRQSKDLGIIDDDFWLTAEPYLTYTKDYSLKELSIIIKKMYYGYRTFPRNLKFLFYKTISFIKRKIILFIKKTR